MIVLFLLFLAPVSEAAEKLWPPEINMFSTIFAPYLPNQYSDIEGLSDFGPDADDLDHYMLIPPNPTWTVPRGCNVENHGSGFIQSIETRNELSDYLARVGVPIFLHLKTSFLGLKKEQLLRSTLLTISIFELDLKKFRLVPLALFKVTFEDICNLASSCRVKIADSTAAVSLDFDGPILTPTFPFGSGQEIRVRVEWNSQGVCDEDSVEFQIGDQIRILDSLFLGDKK